jgi:phosphoribosylamine--glycine ligase
MPLQVLAAAFRCGNLSPMKILVIGGGGREHALCWKLKQSPLVSQIFCSPGNAGIAQVAQCIAGEPVEVARQVGADFVVVGPDDPLADGIVDRLNAAGFDAFGPTQAGAQLEASKIFCKQLLQKYGIPSGDFASFDDPEEARKYLRGLPEGPRVVKADGLALGKGVVVAQDREEAIAAVDIVVEAARGRGQVLVEEFLSGPEVSLLALTDGEDVLPLAPAQDHKRVGEGDVGPNTGGMGCYSPVPIFGADDVAWAVENLLKPTVRALKSEGITYRGVLYAGLMLTESGPKVLEFNCRFGDPETQVILPRLQSDLLPLLLACAGRDFKLSEQSCEWTDEAAITVVMAAHNYPAAPRKGDAITGLDAAQEEGALVFQAGTKREGEGIVTSGGRVLGVTALGADLKDAREKALSAVGKIHFDGAHWRRDIGFRAL